jgi:hypothetical protein
MASRAHKPNRAAEQADSLDTQGILAALSIPDMVLQARYLENVRRKIILEPEMRLMCAMLEDAINCFQTCSGIQRGPQKRLFNDAEEWIMATDHDWIFSFVNVCENLGLSPEYIRQGLRRWREISY